MVSNIEIVKNSDTLKNEKMKNWIKYLFVLLAVCSLNTLTAQTNDDYDDRNDYRNEDDKAWLQNIVVGGSIFPGYSNGWILDVSPLVGYRIAPKTIFGVGFNYFYRDIRYQNTPGIDKDVYNTYGARAFAMQDIFRSIFGQVEVDYNFARFRRIDPFGDIIYQDNWRAPGFLVGAGYKQGDDYFSYNFAALYDLNFDSVNSTRSSPLEFRASFIIALFGSR